MELVNPLVQQYAESYTSPEDDLLKEINQFTAKNHPGYHMLSGHLQGRFLAMVSHMIKPQRVLEIGTFTGYSALCLASGLATGGRLHTIELRKEDAATARGFFEKSTWQNQIILHTGNALDILPNLNESWDLVFIDADKVSYIEYFKIVLPKVKQNGFILADNIFFHGEVLEPPVKGKNAKAIREFNDFVRDREDIDKMILTLRDGLYLIRKL
jgi:predicted O-methyltransferase YrrM